MADNFEEKNSIERTTIIEKCDSCGSDMEFDPEKTCLKCNHCGATKSIGGTPASEIFFDGGVEDDNSNWASGLTTYRCDNCGATTTFEGYDIAPKCPFCSATNVVKEEDLPGMKPNAILPFTRTKQQAVDSCLKWIKRKKLAPNKLRKNFTVNKMEGVYLPCFTFDSRVHCYYTARLGYRKTKVVVRDGKRFTETYTEWQIVSGKINKNYDDLLIEAADQINQKELDKIMPFDTYNSTSFDTQFLAGFKATRYNRSLNSCWNTAKAIIDDDIKRDIVSRHHADEVGYINLNTFHNDTSYKYVLVPVYMCNYIYKGKKFGFLVNGRTGKVGGKIPYSPWKITGIVFAVLAVIAIIAVVVIKLNLV